jgi:hypothetical protein
MLMVFGLQPRLEFTFFGQKRGVHVMTEREYLRWLVRSNLPYTRALSVVRLWPRRPFTSLLI